MIFLLTDMCKMFLIIRWRETRSSASYNTKVIKTLKLSAAESLVVIW